MGYPDVPDGGDKRLEFKYDYLGRRVEKVYQVYNATYPGTWVTQGGFPERYVYDGWNVVLTLNDSNAVTRKLTWGLDLSGTLQGAGGIGGLLAVKTSTAAYWYFYDGNGNVTEVLQPSVEFSGLASLDPCDWLTQILCDPTSEASVVVEPADEVETESALSAGGQMAAAAGGGGGTTACAVLAHYEYDPYGTVLYSSGTYAAANPIRFSTKWCDYELGSGKELYYYGYRYYGPRLGRWLSRDPIGERGGRNLYGFVANTPTSHVDPFGLADYDLPGLNPIQPIYEWPWEKAARHCGGDMERGFCYMNAKLRSYPDELADRFCGCGDYSGDQNPPGVRPPPQTPPPPSTRPSRKPCDAARGFPAEPESWFASSPNWCKDTATTQERHGVPTEVHCYREVTVSPDPARREINRRFGGYDAACPPSRHVCFRQSTGDCEQEHYDRIGSCNGKGADGSCEFDACCGAVKLLGGNQWRSDPNEGWRTD